MTEMEMALWEEMAQRGLAPTQRAIYGEPIPGLELFDAPIPVSSTSTAVPRSSQAQRTEGGGKAAPIQTLKQLVQLGQLMRGMPEEISSRIFGKMTGMPVTTSKEQSLRNALMQAAYRHQLDAPERADRASARREGLDLRREAAEDRRLQNEALNQLREASQTGNQVRTLEALARLQDLARFSGKTLPKLIEELQRTQPSRPGQRVQPPVTSGTVELPSGIRITRQPARRGGVGREY